MSSFSFDNELWTIDDDEVAKILQWAREQDEHDLHELWFTIFFEDVDEFDCCPNYEDGPTTYRSN